MNNHFVYIIFSEKHNVFYKGYSQNPFNRLIQHNNGLSRYTSHRTPWNLVFIKAFSSKSDALKYELMLKRQNHKYISWLINTN